MSTRLLPCRHVFYVRKNENFDTIIPVKLLHPRWLLSTFKCPTLSISPPMTPFRVGSVIPRTTTVPWDTNRKFREAQCVSNAIASNISYLGMRECAVAMNVLQTVSEIFAAKQFDRIIPARNSYMDRSSQTSISRGLQLSPDSNLNSNGNDITEASLAHISEDMQSATGPDGDDTANGESGTGFTGRDMQSDAEPHNSGTAI
ncbi:hypothetical protein PHYSODRAFT_294547 [Phytophthora sojae]|uniref:Uncharacterized protein n=1 Tax=Phytophthora sojae (strain P6497) TaxID=1094619 RepID=G4YQ33_PHYSP|nr:hypothetical protein PHYSODRAFT_294547 [Phytophthora sojae]EGZ29348.1 hypothetical protein PHYSODRAFT_294547 [Phytophthora sojae]|eukprot:XP_009516623.1 hypothetical protein PHYSODRAFT_294547 [Phytophthora sojae]